LLTATLAARAGESKPPKPIEKTEKVKVKATVEAIDHSSRTVTLKGPKGNLVDLQVDPAVTRFDQMKVGDVIQAEYYASLVLELRKAGTKPMEASVAAAAAPTEGKKPSGVAVLQETTTVTIDSIDPSIPAVTVTTMDGDHVSFRVKKKKHLKNVAPGDQVVITRTQGLLVAVQ
jgi:hypothetical protein